MTRWLSNNLALAIHDEQLEAHGGAVGLRDAGLLESALARPQNVAACADPGVAELAAPYAIGIARNHPFVDGNKRTAWTAMVTFLALNDVLFEPPEVEAVIVMLEMAAGDLSGEAFTAWVRRHVGRPETGRPLPTGAARAI